ncbi:hypothetical protein ID866_8273, partial [Astraeus odoratus]
PPALGPSDVEITVEALGIEANASAKSAVTVVGRVESKCSAVTRTDVDGFVVAIASQTPAGVVVVPHEAVVPLPAGVNPTDAAALPPAFLAAWAGLVVRGSINSDSTVLVHDATSASGFSAVQITKRLGSRVLCTVANRAEATTISVKLQVPPSDIIIVDDFATAVLRWLRASAASTFDVVFNTGGKKAFAHGADLLSVFGVYIHVQGSDTPEVPSVPLAPIASALFQAHASQPFKLRSQEVSFSAYSSIQLEDADSVVVIPSSSHSVQIDPAGQLFDPRKSYILVGGSSELGVRITEWMENHGARHVFLTSRRGPRGLTKVDNLYIHYVRSKGVQVEVIVADAVSKEQTATVIKQAKAAGPIGGLFVMMDVLRDAKFTNLTQQSFDDVYESKVTVLNTLLSCIDPTTIDFILLFSTVSSVFGD